MVLSSYLPSTRFFTRSVEFACGSTVGFAKFLIRSKKQALLNSAMVNVAQGVALIALERNFGMTVAKSCYVGYMLIMLSRDPVLASRDFSDTTISAMSNIALKTLGFA